MAAHETLRDIQTRLKAQQHDQRPLIEQVNNQWRNEKADYIFATANEDDHLSEIGCCNLDHPSSCPNASLHLCTSRRFRRMIIYALLALVAAYCFWSNYLQPRLQEEWAYEEGFVSQLDDTYGIAKGGDLDKDFVRIQRLDHKFLPGGKEDPQGKRRLVFLGDVHGCKKELLKLLDKVNFDEQTDHLILTGDVVSKGPDNVGVLDELIRLKATSVRGNHEDRILHVAKSLDLDESLHKATSSKGKAKDAALLKHLNKHHLKYLRDMPLMLHIPTLPQASKPSGKAHSPLHEPILVVHAGLVPDVRLEKQDPYFVMNMRSINRRTHVPSVMRDGKNTRPWFDVWNWYSDRILNQDASFLARCMDHGVVGALTNTLLGSRKGPRLRPLQVVYGHDSKTGLQIHRWSKGLDTACVSGGKLTAMVLDAQGSFELHSVGCENYRD